MPARARSERYALRAATSRLGLVSNISQIKNAGRRNVTAFDPIECEQKILADASAIPHQLSFVRNFRHRFLALCGGYGSGKTYALVSKCLLLSFRSPGYTHLFLEPTIPLLRDVAIPAFGEALEKYKIPHTFRSSPLPNYVLRLPRGDTPIFLRSIENYERIIGINAASISSDEIDTVRTDIAEKAIIKISGRVRVGNLPQIAFGSTPEGHKFLYNFFEKNPSEEKLLIKGKTRANRFLRPGFIESLEAQYPPALIKAYLEGEFVSLDTALIFNEYDPEKNKSTIFQPEQGDTIVFGADFNIGKSKSVYGVLRQEFVGPVLHIFTNESVGDTYALAALVQTQYTVQLSARQVICYPDATGKREYTTSTETDHGILRNAGIKVVADQSNPSVFQTISHANNMLYRGQIKINPGTCRELEECLLHWGYDENYKPRKGGKNDLSNIGDAFRYLAWNTLPRHGAGTSAERRWR